MLRWMSSLLLCLFAATLAISATVHARELPASVTLECSGTVHQDGDADQSQGDTDKATPHHHGGCHGHTLDMPFHDRPAFSLIEADARPYPSSRTDAALHLIDPALRPPTA